MLIIYYVLFINGFFGMNGFVDINIIYIVLRKNYFKKLKFEVWYVNLYYKCIKIYVYNIWY